MSATPLAAPVVLARVAEVLVAAGCGFKFGTDLARVGELVDGWYDRAGAGKFVTVYPEDDERFRALAAELDLVTWGLPGPRILSDRPYRPGSLVHYRYGEYAGTRVLTDDGQYASRLTGLDGEPFTDGRQAWFDPPAWAPPAFPDTPGAPAVPESLLLADRYLISGAIRHANKGGVYRAVDQRDGAQVVVKQARAHVGARLDGTDARDRLRAEAVMLDRLAPLGIAPAAVELFEEQGDLFLVQESVPGRPLHEWAAQRAAADLVGSVALARRLVALVGAVHGAGLVICDLKPQNVMVTPFEEVRLVDVEHVCEPRRSGMVGFTLGFAAPELLRTGVADEAVDRYSLGATLFCVLTGLPPHGLAGPAGIAPLLAAVGTAYPALPPFAALIAGLTQASAEHRWDLSQAADFLTSVPPTGAKQPATGSVGAEPVGAEPVGAEPVSAGPVSAGSISAGSIS